MLWCANCEKFYAEGLSVCPECGGELCEQRESTLAFKKLFSHHDNWPTDENGEPVPPVYLKTVTGASEVTYELEAGLLEAYGIPVLRNFTALGSFGKIVLGFSGTGMDILVPETMYEDAKALLESRPEEEAEL
ncbi:MAG: hypothetical protein II784_01415 [Oscillospiraceae bacterium]|nr:hypothetical protein [Oscillospiraceae bacterium]